MSKVEDICGQIGKGLGSLIRCGIIVSILAFPFMWLWNISIPVIFGLIKIGWTKSFAVIYLSYILQRKFK